MGKYKDEKKRQAKRAGEKAVKANGTLGGAGTCAAEAAAGSESAPNDVEQGTVIPGQSLTDSTTSSAVTPIGRPPVEHGQ
jgi:hypothetical protein